MVNKKLQVNLKPPQRTRGHQTNSKITGCAQTIVSYKTVGTQTDQDDQQKGHHQLVYLELMLLHGPQKQAVVSERQIKCKVLEFHTIHVCTQCIFSSLTCFIQ
jgi:hypothetical protein